VDSVNAAIWMKSPRLKIRAAQKDSKKKPEKKFSIVGPDSKKASPVTYLTKFGGQLGGHKFSHPHWFWPPE
jgi:hypothetical protein